MDQLQTFVLLCGGPFAPSVQQILVQDTVNIPAFPAFDLRYNQYKAIVVNVQGDFPMLAPSDIRLLTQQLQYALRFKAQGVNWH